MKATLKASYTGSTTYTNYLSQAMSAAGMQYTMTYTTAETMSTIGTIKYAPYGTGRRVAVPVS